jgi:hypothetical protein
MLKEAEIERRRIDRSFRTEGRNSYKRTKGTVRIYERNSARVNIVK